VGHILPGAGSEARPHARLSASNYFQVMCIFSVITSVEGPMTKKDKIAFIKSSKRKTHVYQDLNGYTDQQLNDVIREIVQGLIRESEIISNAYINGYR
jgi:hypothetical protein